MIYKLGPIKCHLQDWKFDSFWALLKWKLDPFSVNNYRKESVEVIIQDDTNMNTKLNIHLQPVNPVYKESRGFFEWTIHLSDDEQLLFSLIRRSKNSIYLQYLVSRNWDVITLVTDQTGSNGQAAFEYLAPIMPGVFLKHDLLTLHSALVEYKGHAFAICAPSGTGKTTHARLWRDQKNALILNGDRAVLGKEEQNWIAYGTPWSGTSGEQINRSVPLTAIVVLERGTENVAQPVTGLEAFGAILPHIQCPTWDSELTGKAMDLADDFLNHIPVIRLRCRPDAEAVDVLAQALEDL